MENFALLDINTIRNAQLVSKGQWHWQNLKWKDVKFVLLDNTVAKELLLVLPVLLDTTVLKEHLTQSYIPLPLELKFWQQETITLLMLLDAHKDTTVLETDLLLLNAQSEPTEQQQV